MAFPLPNEYFDQGSITVLRTAYELYKNEDLSSDLVAHFRKQAEAARNPAEALYPRLALSYLAWWEDDKDTAIAEFTRAAETTKAESETRLVLAELHEKRGEPADALAIVDTVKPLDNATMQRREEQALRLAVLTGNLDRARKAAERLFGLRLDTETQVRLAGQMHQLGMHELAESVLGRARRRAGGKASALVGLMLQYQRQDKMEVAVQVALQILRGTTAVRNNNPYYYSSENPDAARASAIQVLSRSGRIKAMIARVEDQLKRTPKAIQLHQALSDYYKADGQREKARAELSKIVELRPDDANLRFQVANQLVQDGQAAEAIPHFKAALKKNPGLLGNSFYEVQNAFRQANKTDELALLINEIDIRSMGQPYYVTNLIQNMMYDDKMHDKVMPLFRKAWEAFPQQRMELIAYIRRDEFWQLPETYEYARQALLPDPSTFAAGNQWYAFQAISSYSSDGRITSTISRMLDLAASQGRLAELTGEIEAAVEKLPQWGSGRAILAMIRCRAAKPDEAKALVNGLIEKNKDQPIPVNALWVIGNELENYAATRDLAISVYEGCLSGRADDPYSIYRYANSPIRRLVHLYEHDGRKEDMRRVLLEFAKPRDFSNYDQEYIEQLRMQGLTLAAQQLVKAGFAAEAVPIFNESMAIAESMGSDRPNYIGNLENIRQQASDGLSSTLQGLDGEQLATTLQGLIRPRPEAKEEGKGKGEGVGGGGPEAGEARPGRRPGAAGPPDGNWTRRPSRASSPSRSRPAPASPTSSRRSSNRSRPSARESPTTSRSGSPRRWPRWPARTATGFASRSSRSTSSSRRSRSIRSPRGRGPTPDSGPRRRGSSRSGSSPAPAGTSSRRASSATASPSGRSRRPGASPTTDGRWPCSASGGSTRSTTAIGRAPRPPGGRCSTGSSPAGRRGRRRRAPPRIPPLPLRPPPRLHPSGEVLPWRGRPSSEPRIRPPSASPPTSARRRRPRPRPGRPRPRPGTCRS